MKWVLFSFLIVFAFQRWLIEVDIEAECFSKKKYKRYKKEHSFPDRLFLVSLKNEVKSKYLKSERRVIDLKKVVTAYSVLTYIMSAVWIADLALTVLAFADVLRETAMEKTIVSLSAFCLLVFGTMYFVMRYIHYNDEKKAGR